MFGTPGGGGGGGCGPISVFKAAATGNNGKHQEPDVEKTRENLKKAFDDIKLTIEVTEKKAAECGAQMIALNKEGNRQAAVKMLQRKKVLEARVANLYGQQTNITTAMDQIDSNALASETLTVMANAQKTLAAQISNPLIQQADAIMIETESHIEASDDLMRAASRQLGAGSNTLTEADLEAEIESMEHPELFTASSISQAIHAALPVPPQSAPTQPVMQLTMGAPANTAPATTARPASASANKPIAVAAATVTAPSAPSNAAKPPAAPSTALYTSQPRLTPVASAARMPPVTPSRPQAASVNEHVDSDLDALDQLVKI